jgi:transcriptional regulator with XRE-family HTH domain
VRLRQQKGWNQKMLAMRLKVTRSRIGKWERGVNAPSLNDLMALTETLGVTFDELALGREAPMVPLPSGIRAEFAMCLNRLLRAVKPILASEARDGEGW